MTREKAIELINNVEEYKTIQIWNMACEEYNYTDDMIYYMEELEDLTYDMKACELLKNLTKEFDYTDGYFKWSIWGLESTNDLTDFIDTEMLLDFIVDNIGKVAIELNDYDFIMA